MTDTEAGLLRAVLERPGDDLRRLVYADWLEENQLDRCPRCNGGGHSVTLVSGDFGFYERKQYCATCDGDGRVFNGNAERAEFIRVQVELARSFHPPLTTSHQLLSPEGNPECEPDCPRCREVRLRQREWKLWKAHWKDWFGGLGVPGNWIVTTTGKIALETRGMTCDVWRGFVEHVTAPLTVLFGGKCGRCRERGYVAEPGTRYGTMDCPDCKGKGRTPGVAPQLWACQPVTRVTPTGTTPLNFAHGHWHWMRGDGHRFSLPEELYDLLPSRSECGQGCEETQAAALDVVSAAAVAYGRSVAAGHTHTVRCESCSGEGCDFKGHGDPKLFCDGSGEVRRRGLPPLRAEGVRT